MTSTMMDVISSEENLRAALAELKRSAAPGVDGVRVGEYLMGLDERLTDLRARLLEGRYTPSRVKRFHTTKSDGSERPIAVLTTEDKLVQRAVLRVLAQRIEPSFFDASFARTGLGRAAACDYVYAELFGRKKFWMSLDVADCYGSLDHEQLLRWLEDDGVEDEVLRLIDSFLTVEAVDEQGTVERRGRGVEQGTPIAMLLANTYLHHAVDLVLAARFDDASEAGDLVYCRYLDDMLVGARDLEMLADVYEVIDGTLASHGLKLKDTKAKMFDLASLYESQNEAEDEPAAQDQPDDDYAPTLEFLGTTYIPQRMPSGQVGWLRESA